MSSYGDDGKQGTPSVNPGTPPDVEELLRSVHEETILTNVNSVLAPLPDGGRILKFIDAQHGRAYTIPFSPEGWKHFTTLLSGIQVTNHLPMTPEGIDAILMNRRGL